MKASNWILLPAAAALGLVSCQAPDSPKSSPPGSMVPPVSSAGAVTQASLRGTRWIADRIDGDLVIPTTQLTLDFKLDHVSGFGGCNGFGGQYDPTHPVAFKDVVITVAGCMQDGIEEQEDAFYNAFVAARSAHMKGERLVMVDAAGRPRVELIRRRHPPVATRPLAGTRWRLESMNGAPVPEGAFVALEFIDQQRFRRIHACQSATGTYMVRGDELLFTSLAMEEDRCGDGEPSPLWRYDYPGDVQQFWNDGVRLHLLGRNHRHAVMRICPACAMTPWPGKRN